MKIKELLAAGLVTLLLLFSSAALADASGVAFTQVYSDQTGNSLHISNEACRLPESIQAAIEPAQRAQLRAAEAKIQGQLYQACYFTETHDLVDPSGRYPTRAERFIYVIDIDGDRYGGFPLSDFRDVDGAAKAPQGAK